MWKYDEFLNTIAKRDVLSLFIILIWTGEIAGQTQNDATKDMEHSPDEAMYS